MRQSLILTTSVVFALSLGTGCSDKKAASKNNFKMAIAQSLKQNPLCIEQKLPADVPEKQSFNDGKLDALVAVELVKRSPTTIEQEQFIFPPRRIKVPGMHYELTLEGTKYKSAQTGMLGTTRLCYAEPEVIEVTGYTEPAPNAGVISSVASYKYRLTHIAAWARANVVREKFSIFNLDQIKDGGAPLILMNEGWRASYLGF